MVLLYNVSVLEIRFLGGTCQESRSAPLVGTKTLASGQRTAVFPAGTAERSTILNRGIGLSALSSHDLAIPTRVATLVISGTRQARGAVVQSRAQVSALLLPPTGWHHGRTPTDVMSWTHPGPVTSHPRELAGPLSILLLFTRCRGVAQLASAQHSGC